MANLMHIIKITSLESSSTSSVSIISNKPPSVDQFKNRKIARIKTFYGKNRQLDIFPCSHAHLTKDPSGQKNKTTESISIKNGLVTVCCHFCKTKNYPVAFIKKSNQIQYIMTKIFSMEMKFYLLPPTTQ